MKKCVKLIAGLLTAMVMMVANVGNVMAATYSWDMIKNPGSNASTDLVVMPLYKGRIYFGVTDMSATCSYYVAICHSTYSDRCYVDNSTRCAKVSAAGAECGFYLTYTVNGLLYDDVYLSTYLEHNGTIGDRISSYGTIRY